MAHERTLILAEFITTASGGRSCPTDSRRWRSSGAVTFQSGRRLIGGAVSRTATRLREAQGGQERPCLRRQGPATRPGRRSAVLGRGLGGVVSAKVAARPSCLRLPDFRATEEARIERGTWKSAFERRRGARGSSRRRQESSLMGGGGSGGFALSAARVDPSDGPALGEDNSVAPGVDIPKLDQLLQLRRLTLREVRGLAGV